MAELAGDKKAADIVILDMRAVCTYTDYFVICSGRSARQSQAISDEVRYRLKQEGTTPSRVEGEQDGDWILIDYLGVVVHVFTPEARDFYRLENLWKDAPRLEAGVE